MSITLSSIFLYRFHSAKYSCNSFLLLSIIFLLGEVLWKSKQSESCSKGSGKKETDSKCQWLWSVWASRRVWYRFLNPPYRRVRGMTCFHLAASLILLPSLCVLFHRSFLSATERLSYDCGCWAVSPQSCGSGDDKANGSLRGERALQSRVICWRGEIENCLKSFLVRRLWECIISARSLRVAKIAAGDPWTFT